MTIENVDQVYDLARIHEQYIVSHSIDGSDHDTHGWVKGTVTDFELDKDDDELDIVIELPWGEKHRYGWSHDNIFDGPLSKVCDAYGYPVSQFERLKGEDIWLKVRYVEIDDGEIDSGTRMTYPRTPTGPNHWKVQAKKYGTILLTMLLVAVIITVI